MGRDGGGGDPEGHSLVVTRRFAVIRQVAGPPNARYILSSIKGEAQPSLAGEEADTLYVNEYVLVTERSLRDGQDFYLFCHACKKRDCAHVVKILRLYYRSSP